MKRVLLLTSTRLRHFALAQRLSQRYQVTMVAETSGTLMRGEGQMARYLTMMDAAELAVFGRVSLYGAWPTFRASGARIPLEGLTIIGFGAMSNMAPILRPSVYDGVVVFGTSWIQGPLCYALEDCHALNLHAGLSPYFRGTACNFWSQYDGYPGCMGYTVHRLTTGLDSGPILRAAARAPTVDPFFHGMQMLSEGFDAVLKELGEPSEPVPQDATKLIRYSRASDFTEAVCTDYLARL